MNPEDEFYYLSAPKHDALAVTSLILSLLWLIGFGSLLAVVLGHVSRREAMLERRRTSALATTGVVIGAIGLLLGIVIWIRVFALA